MLSHYAMAFVARLAALSPLRKGVLTLAVSMFLIEITLKKLAPKSEAYRRWTALITAIGRMWTKVILAVVYFVPILALHIGIRLWKMHLLDKALRTGQSAWHRHDPSPLGAVASAHHQF